MNADIESKLLLSDQAILKIKGYANMCANKYDVAEDFFIRSLEIREDKQVFEFLGLNYCYLKDYKTARDYAIKAIEHGDDNAYDLFTRISMRNLVDFDKTSEVLEKGVKNGSAKAALCLADVYSGNYVLPYTTIDDPFKMIEYLDKAFELSKEHEKGLIAFQIANKLSHKTNVYPYLSKQFKEKSLHYFKIAGSIGCFGESFNEDIFYAACNCDGSVEDNCIESLFSRIDGTSYLIFGLWLLYVEHSNDYKFEINSEPFYLFKEGLKMKNGACSLLCGLEFGSFLGETNHNKAKRYIAYAKEKRVVIPSVFENIFNALIEEYDTDLYRKVFDMPWIYYK